MATKLTPAPEWTFGEEINPEPDGAPRAAELEVEDIDPALIPQPTGFRIVVRPKPAAKQIGSLIVASRTKNADLATRTVGQVLATGALAWTAKVDGMAYGADPVAASIRPGDWVIYRQHGAQRIKIGRRPGMYAGDEPEDQYLLLMSDNDVLAKLTKEQAFAYYDWVS